MLVKCEQCSERFEKLRRLDGRHFCTRRCANLDRSKLGQKLINCVVCQTEFLTKTGNQKCCSPDCVTQWGIIKTRRNYLERRSASRAKATCKHCKREFEYHFRPHRGPREFCGRSCASKHYILTDVYRGWQVNGKRSKFELEIETELKKLYVDVHNTVKVNGWNIDIYVADIDLYVQADGTFWHGLDRPLNEIKLFKNEVDRDIVKNHNRDMEQNTWFREQHKVLLRITDVEWRRAKNKRTYLEKRLKQVSNV